MKKILWIGGSFFVLSLFFILLTFPYERLNRPLMNGLETLTRESLGEALDCRVQNLRFGIFTGFQADELHCRDRVGQSRLRFQDLRVLLLPFFQRIQIRSSDRPQSQISIRTNALFGQPKSVRVDFKSLSLQDLMPFIVSAVPLQQRFFIQDLALAGEINGRIDLPLQQLARSNGLIDLDLTGLGLPPQLMLEQLNLEPIDFDRSKILIRIRRGEFVFEDVELISPDIAAKIEGQFKVESAIEQSQGQVFLKWRIGEQSSLRNSVIAAPLVNGPCPRPDAQNFCTREFNNLAMIENFFAF